MTADTIHLEGYYQEFYIGPQNRNHIVIPLNREKNWHNTYKDVPSKYKLVPTHTIYNDKFEGLIQNNLMSIKRIDSASGWGQDLRMILMRDFDVNEIAQLLTVVISTSPRPQDPDISFNHIKKCYESIRQYDELKHVRIIISCDGHPPKLPKENWLKYLEKIEKMKSCKWENV